MHWLNIAVLIVVVALAFLTGRALRRRSVVIQARTLPAVLLRVVKCEKGALRIRFSFKAPWHANDDGPERRAKDRVA